MGATSSTAATPGRLPNGVDNLIGELGNDIQYERGMGSSRFLRAIKARHKHGPLVVKTFVKPEANFSLAPLVRRIRVEREALADVPNTLTYQKVVETETAGYLIRQWMANSLYDRISTRPFLSAIEKKWITYQLLSAMREASRRNVPHGDLKSENILVTSSLSVYVTDFASSFKQVYLPLNDPSDFNFYFGTSGRRTCYIAPERFYADDSEISRERAKGKSQATSTDGRGTATAQRPSEVLSQFFKRDGKITEAMDVFSMGCVIGELWREGAPMFTLMQLYKYREGNFDIEPALLEISDLHVRSMVRSMLSLDQSTRQTFDSYLESARGVCFPQSFYSFLHQYLTVLQRTSAATASAAEASASAAVTRAGEANATLQNAAATRTGAAPSATVGTSFATSEGGTQGGLDNVAYMMRVEADERIERMYEEWSALMSVLSGDEDGWRTKTEDGYAGGMLTPRDRIVTPNFETTSPYLDREVNEKENIEEILPVKLCIPGIAVNALTTKIKTIEEDGPALLLLSPILANLRNATRPSTKVRCLELLLHLSHTNLSDEAKLDRVLPFVITLFDDEAVAVRVAAVRTVVQLLALVDMITPSNASTFVEYVMPNLRPLTKDSSSLVRAMFASCLHELTVIGTRYLQMTSAMRAEGVFSADDVGGAYHDEGQDAFLEDDETREENEGNFDRQMDVLRSFFQEQVLLLLTDASPMVKRSLLHKIGPLCKYFGSAMASDVILSHMITFLNDRSWQLRKAFFQSIVDVARVVGSRSVEDYILTLLLQALSDPEEFVVLHVLQSLGGIVGIVPGQKPLLSTGRILDVMGSVGGFLCHPNYWLRCAAALVLESGARHLSRAELWAMLYPSIRPLLRCDVEDVTASKLLFAAKAPLSREILQKAVQWAMRAKNSKFWKNSNEVKSRSGLANGLGNEGISLMMGTRTAVRTPIPRNEEDDAHIDSLRSSGLGEHDEVKLIALRDYITKLAKVSSVIGTGAKGIGGSASTVNQEDGSLLPPLQIKSSLAVQPLEDVTPLTIFFTQVRVADSRSAQADTASVQSHVASSTFSGRLAKRRLVGGRTVSEMSVLNPLEELRRRMTEDTGDVIALPSTTRSEIQSRDEFHRSPSTISSAGRGNVGGGAAGMHAKLEFGKAQAAIASDTTTAIGTMAEGSARIKARERFASTTATLESGQTSPAARTVNDEKESGVEGPGDAGMNGGATFTSTYDGNDPYIRAHLEAVYVANFQDRQVGWGPLVTSLSARRRMGGGVGVRAATAGARAASYNVGGTTSTSGLASNRRPEGNMIAYFTEHSAPITSIVVSPDHTFFVSGSEDGKIKVWDTARLEKNVTSRSRGTYSGQRGRIVCLAMLEGSHCVASAATDGSVHVVRVETSSSGGAITSSSSLPKYGKMRLVSNFQLSDPSEYVVCMAQSVRKTGVSVREAAMAAGAGGVPYSAAGTRPSSVPTAAGHTLILATSKGHIIVLDLRTMQVLTNFENPAHLGAIAAMCVDPKNIWLLVATVGGVMCLWDLRFHLLVKKWRLSTLDAVLNARGAPSEASGLDGEAEALVDIPVVRINSVTLHPSKGKERWVMIAFERLNTRFQGEQGDGGGSGGHSETLIETWDVASATCVEVFETVRQSSLPPSSKSGKDRRGSTGTAAHDQSDVGNAGFTGGDATSPAKSDARFRGLESAADAIESLVRMHEASLDARLDDDGVTTTGAEQLTSAAADTKPDQTRFFKGREVIAPAAPTSFVRAMLVGTTGYSSGNVPHAAQVSGGWLDAGKLASESSAVVEDGGRFSDGNVRPAGYLISAGMDRKIRFWDLGKVDKSVAFGSVADEKHEFSVGVPRAHARPHLHRRLEGRDGEEGADTAAAVKERSGGQNAEAGSGGKSHDDGTAIAPTAVHYTHHVYPSSATLRAAASSLRSPLLTHHSSSSTTSMLMKAHKDAITALALIESPFRCIVAGDYAGNIRVWE